MCGDPEESVYHVIFRCLLARNFWREVKKLLGASVPDLHPITWATDVLHPETCSDELTALVVCGAWALWTGRHARNHGRKTWEPGAAARYISSLLEDLASLKVPAMPSQPKAVVKWMPPAEGWMKVNTDAGFDGTSFNARVGVVIRDPEGRVCVAAARWFDDIPDALTAEALGR